MNKGIKKGRNLNLNKAKEAKMMNFIQDMKILRKLF